MKNQDIPVRQDADTESFNRDDSKGGRDEAYKAFTKDRRTRTSAKQAIYSTSYRKDDSAPSGEARHSYNPNFTRENRPAGNRTYGRDENRPSHDFNRSDRPYQPRGERDFNRSDRPYQPRGERDFNRSEGYAPRGDRDFNRSDRPYQPRGERDFNRIDSPRSGGERPQQHYGHSDFRPQREGAPRRDYGYGDRPSGDKPYTRKPYGAPRPYGASKPYGQGRPEGGFQKRSFQRTPAAPRYTPDNYPSFPAPKIDEAIRLNRYIAMSGICSRREADEYIKSGVVTVNGNVVTELGTKVMQSDEIKLNDKVLENEKKVYIVMNKPKGYVTTLDDPHADKSVMDLVKNACSERIYPVGRLDKNSVGVLLLTNDGDLAKKLTHPAYEKKKVYQVTLDRPLARADMEQLIKGVTLEDGDIAADDISAVEDSRKKNEVGIEIHSGRNRVVRRMFEAVGYRVGKLDRVYFAGLTKQKLKRGDWRFLTPQEVSMLKSGSYE